MQNFLIMYVLVGACWGSYAIDRAAEESNYSQGRIVYAFAVNTVVWPFAMVWALVLSLVRSHIAAHAPKKIPDWFKPAMEKPYNPFVGNFREVFGANSNHPHRDFVKKHYDYEDRKFTRWVDDTGSGIGGWVDLPKSEIPAGLEEEINKWRVDIDRYLEVNQEYDSRKIRERVAQWPWAYADMVMSRRRL